MRDDTPTATRKLLTLGQFPGLAGTELGEQAMIAGNVVEAAFAPGTVVAAPLERVPAIQMVVDGRIVSTAAGGEVTAWGPLTVFGALEVMASRAVTSPAVAVAPTRTLQLAAADFVEVLEDNYNLLSNVRRELAGRLIEVGTAHGQIDVGGRGKPNRPPVIPTGPLGMVDRLVLIRPQIPFALGKIQALAALAQGSEEVHYPVGATISRAGDRADGALVIVDGTLLATRAGLPPRVLTGGDAIGRLETLAQAPHTLTVESLTPVRALRCPGRVLFDVMEDHTDLAFAMVATLAGELLDAAAALGPELAHWGPS